MKEILKAIATANDWGFEYGREDFQNLYDVSESDNTIHLFLDPVGITKNRGDNQEVHSITYSGLFMLLKSSDVDEVSYEYRYENYIKPLIDTNITSIEDSLVCNSLANIDTWDITEIINVFDYNLDGVMIKYKITIDE